MKRYVKKLVQYFEFDGAADFGGFISRNHRENGYSVTNQSRFFGGSFETAMQESQTGSVARVAEFKGHIDALKFALVGARRIMRADVSGPLLDVPAYLSGLPECFRRFDRKPDAPAVNIAVDMLPSGHAKADEIYNRGAAIVALVEQLQTIGRKVNLTLCYEVDIRDFIGLFLDVTVKIKLDPIDLSEIAFILSPLCCRRLSFALTEILSGRDYCISYGNCERIKRPAGPAIVFKANWEDDSAWSVNYATPENAAQHVEKLLEEFNTAENDAVIEG